MAKKKAARPIADDLELESEPEVLDGAAPLERDEAEHALAVTALDQLRDYLDDSTPGFPRTGIAGILPPWLALLLKLYGPKFVALVESDLGVTPPEPVDPEAPVVPIKDPSHVKADPHPADPENRAS